ncbi:hypothetical protein [Nonomuraea sp. NPDC050540]|uniref:hypothetical protein n=1 Tax=Nonomuraea sp. NPDC050540 TaxID=3364367 RepID=UPI0037B0D723
MRHINLLNHPEPLNIESLYVQLRVHDRQPLRFMHHEELQELRGRAPGGLSRLTRARKKDRQAEILTPEEAFTRFRRMVDLGDPGAGKTTMLRYLGFKAATDEILPAFDRPPGRPLPQRPHRRHLPPRGLRGQLPAFRTLEVLDFDDARRLIERIGDVGEDVETVHELLKVIEEPGLAWDPDVATEALAEVSRRAQVCVYPTGAWNEERGTAPAVPLGTSTSRTCAPRRPGGPRPARPGPPTRPRP